MVAVGVRSDHPLLLGIIPHHAAYHIPHTTPRQCSTQKRQSSHLHSLTWSNSSRWLHFWSRAGHKTGRRNSIGKGTRGHPRDHGTHLQISWKMAIVQSANRYRTALAQRLKDCSRPKLQPRQTLWLAYARPAVGKSASLKAASRCSQVHTLPSRLSARCHFCYH